MKYLVMDIETVLDPRFPPPASNPEKKDGLRSPPYWQVVTIGCMLLSTKSLPAGECYFEVDRLGVVESGKTEAERIKAFVNYLQPGVVTLVTFNGRSFDLPVIVARAFLHAVSFPFYYNSRDVRYRYSAEGHLDLMDFLSDYGASKFAPLDVWAKLCGMPGKVGVDGSMVESLVAEGRQEEVDNYCLCDVAQTAAVFLRTEFLRGRLTPEGHVESMARLFECIQKDPRLSALDKALSARPVESLDTVAAPDVALEVCDGL